MHVNGQHGLPRGLPAHWVGLLPGQAGASSVPYTHNPGRLSHRLSVCRCNHAPTEAGHRSSTAAQGLWGAWSAALYSQHVPPLELVNVQTPQLYVLPNPAGVTVTDTATEAAAAATKRRLLGAVSQAERRATSLAKKVKLVSEAVGQDFTTPEGVPPAGAGCAPLTIAGLQQELQQLQDQQQRLEQQYTTAEAERQQLVAMHRQQAAQLQQELEAARGAAGGPPAGAGRTACLAYSDRKELPQQRRKQRARVKEVLLPEHFAPQLAGAWLELYWPEDGTWYRVQCVSVNMQQRTAIIAYETEEEEKANLLALIHKQQVAWADD